MSLNIPYISFEAGSQTIGPAMTCTKWGSQGGADFNGIKLNHLSGSTNLIHKKNVSPGARNLYPVSNQDTDAEYISHDNWLLDCFGNEYRVRSPNGVTYYFNANKGSEHFIRRRHTAGDELPDADLINYKFYVDRIERLNSQLKFFYSPVLPTNDPANPWAPQPQNYRVRPPMHFEAQYKDTPDTGSIQTKKRLMRVELRAGNENSADSANTENQFVYFTYNATTELCPGLLKSVHSISTDVSKVWYEYDPLTLEHQRSQSAPHSRCLLKNVYRNAHWSPNVDKRERAWSFTYGAVGSSTPFFMPASNGRGEWWQYHSKPVSHLPLHSVMTPTGATTTYEYRSGSVCEYQDSHDNYGPNPVSKCSGSSRAGTPFVTARTVAGDDVITQRSTIHYARIDDQYRVERKIQNAKTIKKLVFGRMNLTKLPSGKLIDEPKWHQYVDSNQLLRYELLDATNPNLKALVTVKHFYQEGLLFPKTKAIFTTGTNNAGYASWFKSRNMHMFNSRRINLIRTETEVDGITYETHYNGFDAFDNPTAIVEKHNDGSVASQRSIGLAYHNSTGSWNNYYVGSLKFKSTTSGTTLPLIESYGYNAQGQLATKRIAGFKTSYTYHYNGNLHQVIDGRNIDERRFNYKMGIAQNIVDRDGKQTTRVVDKYGRIRSETDPEGVKNTYTYNYNDFYNRVSSANVNPSGSYYKSRFYKYAQFTDSTDGSTYRFDRETVYEKYLRATRYDALGRVIYTHERDITGAVQHRIQRFKYDNLGRLIFKGQVRKDWSTAYGTHYEYDNYGRIKNIRYPLANSPAIQYCHGPSCDGNFGAAGPVRDGYAIRDQLGYVTVRNYRAFGSPDNRELIEIRQEIRPVAFNDKQDDVVITNINRNKAGFITSVAQKGNSSGILTRAYEPYTVAGSMTFLVKSETHPEFGTKTVTQFDENGNTIKVENFNKSVTTYVYDPMDRLRYALNPGSSGATAGVPTTEFRYRKNGTLEKAIQGNVTWEYGYNEINLLDEEKLTIDSETFVIKYDYDDFAQIKAITYPGVGTAPGRVVSYTSSGFGQAKSVTGFASKIEYHPTGIASLIDFENGTQFISTQDNYQRPSIWQTKSASGANYQNFIYQYDLRSNVKKINNYFPPNGGSLTNLQYDGLNRLTRADASGVWGIAQFSYDPIGNIDKKYVGGHNRNYVYGVNNKLNSVTAANQPLSNYVMGYDGNGNVISTGVADYQFDQLNRLVRFDDGSAILDNTYDAHNMRVKGATTRNAQVSSTYYVYNRAGQLLHELDSETGETRDHIQLNGRTVATIGSHNFVDSDNDGMPDYFERQHGLSVFSNDAFLDDDKDGRSNLAEYLYDHLPTNADTDNDGIPDGQDSELPPFIQMLEQPGGVDLTPIYRYLLE